jgi:hypothetical protein
MGINGFFREGAREAKPQKVLDNTNSATAPTLNPFYNHYPWS